MFDINAILTKADLLAYVERAGGEPKGNGKRYACACPLHGGDNPTAFSIYYQDGKWKWNCFTGSCGGGDAITFVEKWQGLDFKRACEWINGGAIEDAEGMKESAAARLEAAKLETMVAKEREEARRHELQIAERHLYYHKNMKPWAREMWIKRGIDEGMQDFWNLGSCEDFVINGDYHTPTLTIPIFDEGMELLNIKHRLVHPPKPNDKYRPETSGLGAFPPFLAVPSMGYDGDLIIVTEGEIKAAVVWTKISGLDIQCIGVPGRSQFRAIADRVGGKNVIVIPDPGAEKDAFDFARQIKGKYLPTPEKIDDYLLRTNMQAGDFTALLKQARKA